MPKGNTMKQNKHKKRSKLGHRIKITLQVITLFTLLAILGIILYFYINYGKTILQMQAEAKQEVGNSTEETFRSSQTSLIYDAQGEVISTLKANKDVYYLKYEDIPQAAIDAELVTEDRKFFEHDGVDYLANVRAAISLIKNKGHITQGASTITQQLARNIFLSMEVTYTRKIKEIFFAQELEKKYTKDQIMEFYLNAINFSNGHYGIQAAAQAYFGTGVNNLSISQIAFLCAIPNNPNLYNPLTKMDNTIKRRDRVLKQMFDYGKITQTEYDNAINEKIVLTQNKSTKTDYVLSFVRFSTIRALMEQQGFKFKNQFDSDDERNAYDAEYEELYDSIQKNLYTHGYRIYTSIDMDKQKLLQKSVDDTLAGFKDKDKSGVYKMQGAAVCIDNDTGRVAAIVGGREQDLGSFTLNRAYQSYRQPGSTIKPLIVYTPSFERDYTPNSIVNDKYSKDGPKNSNGRYLGKIKLQTALEKSINTIAWKLFKELTPRTGLSYLLRMNFNKITDSDYTLASALGGLTNGVSPIEMASAYATLENDGYYREPTCIVKIMDSEGNVVVDDKADSKEVYDTNATRIMTEALTGVIKKGTARGLGLRYTVSAGKTGTTNNTKDGWFVGYTPYYTTSVWVGYDIPVTVSNLMGATYPGRIWHDFMDEIHTSSMNRKFKYYNWKANSKEEEALITVTPTPAPTVTPDPGDGSTSNDGGNGTIATPTPIPDPNTGDGSGTDNSGDGSATGDGSTDNGTSDGTTIQQPSVPGDGVTQ